MANLLNIVRNVNRYTPFLYRPPDFSQQFQRKQIGPQELTEADLAIMPHIGQAKEEFERKRGLKGFVQKLFEILQTGNYMSANVFDSIYDSARQNKPVGEAIGDMLEAAWKGLSHQEKTTFSDVIKQNIQEYGDFFGKTEEQWLDPIIKAPDEDPERNFGKLVNALRERITPASVAGLAGDIFLDPLTYINPMKAVSPMIGASTKARSAGWKFADDAVRLDILSKNFDELKKLIGNADYAQQVQRVADAGGDIAAKVQEIATKTGNKEFSRYLDDIVRDAMKRGTLTPESELVEQMSKGLGDVRQTYETTQLDRLAAKGGSYEDALKTIERPRMPQVYDELEQSIQRGYKGAGTRSWHTIFGEGRAVEAQPNVLARGFDKFGEFVKDTPVGKKISDAWWALMNRPGSPVGYLRKTLGIRNPYQKLVHHRAMDAQQVGRHITEQYVARSQEAIEDLGDDLYEAAVKVRGSAESVEFAARKAGHRVRNTSEFIDQRPDVLKKSFGLDDGQLLKIKNFWGKMDGMFDDMFEAEQELVKQGLLPAFDDIVNYLPKRQQNIISKGRAGTIMGTQTPGFTEATKFTTKQSVDQMAAQFKVFYGDMFEAAAEATGRNVDEYIRNFVADNNLAQINLSLPELLNNRIVAHARAMSRSELVKKFREFGIPIRDLAPEMLGEVQKKELMQSVGRTGGGIPSLGLYSVKDPAFKGFLFDKDIADIITRTYELASSDEAIQMTKKLIGNLTQWWKGWVTASSGFHMRNHFSNHFTGFMRHGMPWFEPKRNLEAWVLAQYALSPDNFQKHIDEMLDVSEGFVRATLNKRIGGMSQRELVDYMREKGMVGWGTFFSDVEKKAVGQRGRKFLKSTVGQDNPLLKGSRWAGDRFETKAKVQSFLMTFEDIVDGNIDAGLSMIDDAVLRNASALEWAKLDTKKWFIDYGDLTEAERKIKMAIPFYSWLRGNIANQLTAITMYPDVLGVVADISAEATVDGFPMVLMPEWQKTLGYLPIAQDDEGKYVMFFPNLPYQDLNKIPLEWEDGSWLPKFKGQKFWDELVSNAHPVIKRMMEKFTHYNLFEQREYLDEVRAPGLAKFFAKSPKVIEALDSMMRFAGYENGLRVDERNGKVMIDEGMERSLAAYLPVLRTVDKIIDLGIDVSGIEEAINAATGREDDYEGLEDLLQGLSYFGGIKFKQFQEEFEREQANEAIEERAQELQREERRRLPGYDQRVREYLQAESERRARRGLY